MQLPESTHDMSRWVWPAVFLLIAIGLIFGTWGFVSWGAEVKEPMPFHSAVYHAIQLFGIFITPQVKEPYNWQMEIGRWATAISSYLMIILILYRWFIVEWRLFFLRRKEEHVVICGLGEVGKRLAKEFCKT